MAHSLGTTGLADGLGLFQLHVYSGEQKVEHGNLN